MKRKRACLVINPHAGQNVTKIVDLIAVLSAAGWSTEIAIKEYGGHSMELAARAAQANYDLLIGYGGDGTLNQVLNGVMTARDHSSIIAVIPGGTANVWAAEMGVPLDPIQAALTLINSKTRKIDIGHIEVERLSFPDIVQDVPEKRQGKKAKQMDRRETKATTGAKHHFMLWAGLGIDAAIMEHVSKDLKYRVGPLAVGLSVVEELPRQHPFPIEIRISSAKNEGDKIWKGEAWQVIVGNIRRYANFVQMTPDAYLDSGLLEVCVITTGNTLTTLEQIASLMFRRRPSNVTAEYFHGSRITISVPTSIDLHLDGSAVKLKDYLNKSDCATLQSAGNAAKVMVSYRFDAIPRAVQMAIPTTYNGELFEKPLAEEKPKRPLHKQKSVGHLQQNHVHGDEVQHESSEQFAMLLAKGHQVTVKGVAAQPQKQHTYIIAGTVPHHMTGDTTPVALCVDESVAISSHSGEQISITMIQKLQEGSQIIVMGKKSKYGVIQATRVVI